MVDAITRGDIYWADLSPRSSSEQAGRRPVIVLSHDGFNHARDWRSVIVVSMSTSKSQLRRGLTVVEIPVGASGLPCPGIAICHQVTTLDRSKLARYAGRLSRELLSSVEEGLKAALDLE
jgi:mRNA interferase MazF